MDTKRQSLPATHPHPHSSSRSQPQGYTCNQCSTCALRCRNCRPASHPSTSCSPSPSPPSRHPKKTMQSQTSSLKLSHHRGRCPRNRKTLKGKVNKRKAVRRRKRTHGVKRRSSGRRYK